MQDDAGQRLAQGKILNGRDFARSKGISKRTERPIGRLRKTPVTILGAPKYDQKGKKSTFPMCHENTKINPKKVKSDPETTFCAPSGHHEVPDGARQRLAQGKNLNGRDFVRSKRS